MDRLWIWLTVLAVAGLILFGLLLRKRYRALQEWKKDYQPPQMRFKYELDQISAEFDDMGQRERLLMRQFDGIFVRCYDAGNFKCSIREGFQYKKKKACQGAYSRKSQASFPEQVAQKLCPVYNPRDRSPTWRLYL